MKFPAVIFLKKERLEIIETLGEFHEHEATSKAQRP